MKFLKKLFATKPLSLQMIVVAMLCMLSMCVTNCLYTIFVDGLDVLIAQIKDIYMFFGINIPVCVPVCTATLLFIHLCKIYQFIIYNTILIIVESALFYSTLNISISIIDQAVGGYYYMTGMLASVLSTLYFAFFIKKIFPGAYSVFQNRIMHEYIDLPINKRIDLVVTIIFTLLFVTPALIIGFLFSLFMDMGVMGPIQEVDF